MTYFFYSFVERYATAYQKQFEAFFMAIRNDTEVAVNVRDVWHAVAAAQAANQSLNSNKPIPLPINQPNHEVIL